MRIIPSLLAIFFCLNLCAQLPQSSSSINSKSIIAFVDSNMGKKVGRGVCYELVKEANGGGGWVGKKWAHKKKYKVKEPKIGDAISFEGVVYYDNDGEKHIAMSHIGIVYQIGVNGNIIFAHQNSNVCKGNPSKVILTGINYKMIEKGKIRFYRFN